MAYDTQESRQYHAGDSGRRLNDSVSDQRLFNAFELRLFRYTAVLLSLVALTVLVCIVIWTLSLVLSAFSNLLLSLALAGILALVLSPVVNFFESQLHFPRVLSVIVVLAIFFIAIGGMFYFLVPTLLGQIVELMTLLPETLAGWQEHMSIHFPQLTAMISDRMADVGSEDGKSMLPGMEQPGSAIMSYLGVLVAVSFVPLLLFFTLLSGDALRGKAAELLSVFRKQTQEKALYFMDVFVGYVTAFFQGQLIIAVSMGALYAIGFSIIGLQFGILSGLVLGLLNIVPFLGTAIGLIVILPMAFLQANGGGHLLILTALVFAAVQLVESFALTPRIMANHSGLHPALVVISLFFWGIAFGGIIGMVLAVPLTAFFVAIWSEIKASVEHTLGSQQKE